MSCQRGTERQRGKQEEDNMPKWMSFKLFKESSRVSTNYWTTLSQILFLNKLSCCGVFCYFNVKLLLVEVVEELNYF